jgi:uncharacterized protein YndB with AHSA1/START domain
VVRIEFAVAIERPPAVVFDYLSDIEHLPEWQGSALETHAEAPLAEGVRVFEKRRVMGREVENELEVAAYDPPRRLALRALSGPVRFTVDHDLVEEGGGTRLRVLAEAKPGSFMKLAEPMLARTAEQELRKDFDRLKEILESR